MSSPEEDRNDSELIRNVLKGPRIQRACDTCRRKKIRCDGPKMQNNRCTYCVSHSFKCTYLESARKRAPAIGYVESLETRLENMEKLLNMLNPDADFSKELGGSFDKDGWAAIRSEPSSSSTSKPPIPTPSSRPDSIISPPVLPSMPQQQGDADDLDSSDDEIDAQRNIAQNLNMTTNPNTTRFHGKSSNLLFIQTAMDFKHEHTGIKTPKTNDFHPPCTPLKQQQQQQQQQHWRLHPWLPPNREDEHLPHKDFPPPDLLSPLVDLYFANMNDFLPLLHRPTFEQGVREGLHFRDEGFGSTVLLVCANGARFADDPRVLLDEREHPQSAGWKWFQQVQMVRKSLLEPPRLYDLQIYALTAGFLQCTSAPQASWTIIGVGIRMAQEVGAHRKKVYSAAPTVEGELWRRAFWVLVAMDRSKSFALGRPCAIQDEDFDTDLPTECDDEYWAASDAGPAFTQPQGKPSKLAFFNCFLRLQQILVFAMRTIYSINKSKALLGFVGQQWEQRIVAELDSALNKWIDTVPDHLRWDPTRENTLFLNQSANLYANYYQLRIAVHRPFIPPPHKPSPLSFPSLAICTNAARSCIHVFDVQARRSKRIACFNQMSLFTAGIVLLLNVWGGKRSGLSLDLSKEMADVHKCMRILRLLEPLWHSAKQSWDILYELASVGDLPLPQVSPFAPSQKRARDADSPSILNRPTFSLNSELSVSTDEQPGSWANNGPPELTVSTFEPPEPAPLRPEGPSPWAASVGGTVTSALSENWTGLVPYTLPLHTEELGRIPGPPHPSGYSAAYASDWYQPPQQQQQPPPHGQAQAQQQQQVSVHISEMDAPGQNGALLDPGVMSMYALQASGFGEMFTAHLASEIRPMHQHHGAQTGSAGGGVAGGVAASGASTGFTTRAGGGVPAMTSSEEVDYADNMLTMWPSAMPSLQWDDWEMFINNMGGMQNASSAPGRTQGGGV